MKPFVLFLLLIGSGVLFAMLSRPFETLVELGVKLQHYPARFPARRIVSAGLQAAGSSGSRSFNGNGWRQAAQF
ncbi:MAG TPA: hypothetical protein VJ995_07210 [Geothermobacteraceae bacterium]|nr:hypothetical protein [Geothermobacteraceae bacterium]